MLSKKKAPITEEQALLKLATLCSQAEHSSGEMREKMRRWQLNSDAQERIISQLTTERYIDDARYARLFVRDRLRFAAWGERKISAALFRKGIDKATADEALAQITDEEWLATLRPLIAAKRRTTTADTDYELNGRLMRHALAHGFPMRLIMQCLSGDSPEATDEE